jgi:NAD(P)-dependent dehydrogenase (short-subunit alcohol dehydrogenase family)
VTPADAQATDQRLAGRTAIVIGAARGIGAGIAERFLEAGAAVVCADADRSVSHIADRLASIGPTAGFRSGRHQRGARR